MTYKKAASTVYERTFSSHSPQRVVSACQLEGKINTLSNVHFCDYSETQHPLLLFATWSSSAHFLFPFLQVLSFSGVGGCFSPYYLQIWTQVYVVLGCPLQLVMSKFKAYDFARDFQQISKENQD